MLFRPNYDEAVIGRVYFIYSFGFLLVRTTAVSMVAADVDSESKKPIECLNSLPYYIYNDEVKRLLQLFFFKHSSFCRWTDLSTTLKSIHQR